MSGGGLILSGAEGERPHLLIRGFVVLGCEGYQIISPAALVLDPGQWEDWRGSRDAAYINDNSPGLGYPVTLFGECVGDVDATYPEALARLRAAFAGLPPTVGGADPDIYYATHAHDLIVKFPCRLAEVRQDWNRPARLDDELWWASLPPHIEAEAMCLLCGQSFNPGGPDDLTRGVTLAGDPVTGREVPCGAPGVLLGAWGAPRHARQGQPHRPRHAAGRHPLRLDRSADRRAHLPGLPGRYCPGLRRRAANPPLRQPLPARAWGEVTAPHPDAGRACSPPAATPAGPRSSTATAPGGGHVHTGDPTPR